MKKQIILRKVLPFILAIPITFLDSVALFAGFSYFFLLPILLLIAMILEGSLAQIFGAILFAISPLWLGVRFHLEHKYKLDMDKTLENTIIQITVLALLGAVIHRLSL